MVRYVWLGAAILGVGAAAKNAVDAQLDLRALRQSGRNGVLLITAEGSRNDQMVTLGAIICSAAASVLAIFSKPSNMLLLRRGPWVALIGTVGMVYVSFSQRRRRRALLNALRLKRRNEP